MMRPHPDSRRTTLLVFIATAVLMPGRMTAQESPAAAPQTPFAEKLREAIQKDDLDSIIELTEGQADVKTPIGYARAGALQERGQRHFFAARIAESIRDFDAYLTLYPKRDPHHWQRGISYYYAEKYKEGKAQFERHQNVNTQDVENAVWHFICAVRCDKGSVVEARKNLIPITKDTRVPMKQIHELFAGTGTVEDVLEASTRKNDKCYAHLYLGLYYEAIGEKEKAKSHMELSANDFRMNHYMGRVSQVHAKLRGWKSPLE